MKEKEAKTAQDFDLYIVEARNRFVDKINQQEWRTELRTEAENLLVAYDQMREKISAMEAFHQSKMVEEVRAVAPIFPDIARERVRRGYTSIIFDEGANYMLKEIINRLNK